MEALYLFKHSPFLDLELRYSLRSLARRAPWIHKVWIFGDRPEFLATDTSIVECVGHAQTAADSGKKLPLVNHFLLLYYASLIPALQADFLVCSDDYYLLRDLTPEVASRVRYHRDMSQPLPPSQGKWPRMLAATRMVLLQLGYPAYNFETHTPTYLRKEWVAGAYTAFLAHTSEDRFGGLMGLTAVLTHAQRTDASLSLTHLSSEGSRAGFWREPPTKAQLEAAVPHKTFFNHDDVAFGVVIAEFLRSQFPDACKYERVVQ